MKKIIEFTKSKLPEYFIENHIKAVVHEAKWLASFYPEADREVVEAGAWLHDVGHIFSEEEKRPRKNEQLQYHHIRSSNLAQELFQDMDIEEKKSKKIIHCIKSHRTSKPPAPDSIEAKIVASADNLSHFVKFEFLSGMLGVDYSIKKIERDLEAEFMVPEATKKAKSLLEEIKKKYEVKK